MPNTEQKIILFDLDQTLFNSSEHSQRLDACVGKLLDLDSSKYLGLYQAYKDQILNGNSMNFRLDGPGGYIEFIIDKFGIDEDKKTFIDALKRAIYTDQVFLVPYQNNQDLFNQLMSMGFEIGIFSHGDVKWQRIKLFFLGIRKMINRNLIFIHHNKLEKDFVANIPAGVIVVDDLLSKILVPLAEMRPDLHLFWINRNGTITDSDTKLLEEHKITTLNNLSELVEYLS